MSSAGHAESRKAAPGDVDVFFGSGGLGFSVGSNSPAAQVPFGFARVGPDTSGWFDLPALHCGGYYFPDSRIRAFSHTRLVGAGVADYGTLGIMPVFGPLPALPSASAAPRPLLPPVRFSHDHETARPGYYSVRPESGVLSEMAAAGTHASAHRHTFPDADRPAALVLDACHTAWVAGAGACQNASLELLDAVPAGVAAPANKHAVAVQGAMTLHGTLSGRAAPGAELRVFFAAAVTASAAPSAQRLYRDGGWTDARLASGVESDKLAAVLQWASGAGLAVEVRVGLSLVDEAAAWNNLRAQKGSRAFDAIAADAAREWADEMARFVADPQTPLKTADTFRAAAYRAMCAPTTYSEADGRYRGADGAVHTWPPAEFPASRAFRSDLSLWDTHRTHVPWTQLTSPAVAADTLASVAALGKQAGALPKWPLAHVLAGCMTGAHGIVALGDGLRAGTLPAAAAQDILAAALRQVTSPSVRGARVAVDHYLAKGFVPAEASSTAASRTMEYAFDDWAVARIAHLAGNATEARAALARATNFAHTFHGTLPCPRHAGAQASFDCPVFPSLPYPLEHRYVEGDASQWRWFAPQHPWALVALWPSPAAFVGDLDAFFDNSRYLGEPGGWWPLGNAFPDPHYWAGNEPGLFTAWLFLFAGRPDLTQRWTRWLAEHRYSSGPAGLPGNDDYGTMSAWLLWVSMGLYPAPGSGEYLVGSPALPGATLRAPVPAEMNGGTACSITITMTAANWSPEAVYVASLRVNGEAVDHPSIPISALGGSFNTEACGGAATRSATIEFTMATTPQQWAQGTTPPRAAWGYEK